MSGKSWLAFVIVCLMALFIAGSANAQGAYNLHEKGIERLSEARNVAPLSVDSVFGDQISNFNGGAEFAATDISVPGNNGLPVELRRVLRIDDRSRISGLHLGGFAEWDLDIPYLYSEVSLADGWKPSGGTVNQRCSVPGSLPDTGSVAAEDYWGGYKLHVAGAGDQTLLMNPSTSIPAAAGGPYPWITKGFWRISCKSSTKNGYAGQAFVALSPDGMKYHLDWVVTKAHSRVNGDINSFPVSRQVVYFLVSRIEDRFGNWVDYTYSGDKLTSITSSDTRQISLTWTGNKITSAGSSIGAWSYAYTGEKLAQVTRPDASKWTYASTGALAVYPPGWSPAWEDPTGCPDSLEIPTGSYNLTITAPSGAVGQYAFDVRQHGRTNIPEHACHIQSQYYWFMKVPRFHWSLSLISKTVSGPGLPAMVWNYNYGFADPFSGTHTKETTVAGPNNTFARYTYGTGYELNEGQLLLVERGSSANTILRSEATTYVSNAEAAAQYFPAAVGDDPRFWGDRLASAWLRPVKQKVTSQQGVNFNWLLNVCASKYCTDAFGNPTSVTKASTLPGSPSKVVQTEYEHNTTYWVLGQVKKTTEGSYAASETTYNALALPWVMSSFGRVVQTLTYNADGTVATVKDGNTTTIALSNWYRGIPQLINYPDSTTQSAVVSGAGWITSVTDESGYKTCYGYDAMGRINLITYPSETQLGVCDASAWNPTAITFAAGNPAAYGMPAGNWWQTTLTGNSRKTVIFDALWRPVVEQTLDLGNVGGTLSEVISRYDTEGRLAFQSYPMNTGGQANYADTNLKGIWTTYDALGRTTSVSQSSELTSAGNPNGLLTTHTEYLPGFQTRVTNPRGLQSTTSYMAYDQPTYDWPTTIVHPEGAITEIARDVFGKPTAIGRRNANTSVALSRHYVYDTHQQLCKVVEPETKATVLDYDNAGNLVSSAAGVNLLGLSDCNVAEAATSGRQVQRSYDARNRVSVLSFPDGNGNQRWTYWPDGQVKQVTTANAGVATYNSYAYNRRRLLVGESLSPADGEAWALAYNYTPNGHLASTRYPSGQTVTYAPNALGQATQASNYATGVSYYPNGAIKQFTYGNGIVHTMTQNARQLPDVSQDAFGGTAFLSDGYDYDHNGNVAAISDGATGRNQRGNRTMAYDGLDRLTQAVSPMFGTATYGYDVLDNLTRVIAPGRDHHYCYDGNWQLTNVKVGGCNGSSVIGLGYDVQGNLSNKNGQLFAFDYGNRLREATGKESYRYDGHGRRTQATHSTGTIRSMYDQAGVLRHQKDARQKTATDYIQLGGSLVAEAEWPMGHLSQTRDHVNWSTVGGAVRYVVEESVDGVTWTSVYEGSDLGWTSLERPSGTYTYRVLACNDAGVCSPASGVTHVQRPAFNIVPLLYQLILS